MNMKADDLKFLMLERAAIKEFCGNISREEDERQTREEFKKAYPPLTNPVERIGMTGDTFA